jgi:hypothetical protein
MLPELNDLPDGIDGISGDLLALRACSGDLVQLEDRTEPHSVAVITLLTVYLCPTCSSIPECASSPLTFRFHPS